MGASKYAYRDQWENQQLFQLLVDFVYGKEGIVRSYS